MHLGHGLRYGFQVTPASGSWTETVLYNFQGQTKKDGAGPQATLVFDSAGALYGTTSSGGANGDGVVFKLTPPASGGTTWIETVLYSFKGGVPQDSNYPEAA